MNKKIWRVVKGFIVTLIILSFAFALSLSFMVIFSETEHSKVALFFTGIIGWFIHAIPVAIIIFVVFGIPGYILLNKLGCRELKHYITSGAIVGGMVPLTAQFFMDSIEWWAYIVSILSVMLASFIFWRVSIKS